MAFSAPFSAPQMDCETNDSTLAFGKFRQKCELIFKSILKEADGEEQVSYILLWVGEQGIDIFGHSRTRETEKTQQRFLIDLWSIYSHGQIIEFTGILCKVCDKTKVSQSIILLLRSRTLELMQVQWQCGT